MHRLLNRCDWDADEVLGDVRDYVVEHLGDPEAVLIGRRCMSASRPPFGMPKGTVLLATPDGWRYSVLTMEGGMLCGRLSDEPLDPEGAPAATTMVNELACDFHDSTVEVTWDPRPEPWSWTGRVIPVSGGRTALTDSGG